MSDDSELSTPLLTADDAPKNAFTSENSQMNTPLLIADTAPERENALTLHGQLIDLAHLNSLSHLSSLNGTNNNHNSGREHAEPSNNHNNSGDNVELAQEEQRASRSLSLEERTESASTSLLRQAVNSLSSKGCKLYHGITGRLGKRRNNDDDSTNNLETSANDLQTCTIQSSLATSPTTHTLLKYLLPPFLLLNHLLFYRAQTLPMWNLSYNLNISVSATASTFKSRQAFNVLNLDRHYEFIKKERKVVEEFTYMDAIRKLWRGEGLGDARGISKVSAVLLVAFSGIWPHAKLACVNFCWFWKFGFRWSRRREYGSSLLRCDGGVCRSNGRVRKACTARSRFLRFLSVFGKWSLADVLVVCVLIAVLHLDWEVNLQDIRSGVEEKLPTILSFAKQKYPDEVEDCKQLLNYECAMGHALVIHYPACLACETLIKNAFYHPDWTVSEGKDILDGITLEGGGYAQLRVVGMVGTYFFCGAVILSILLSLVVDAVDEVDRTRVEEELSAREKEVSEVGNDLQLTANIPPNQAFNLPGLHHCHPLDPSVASANFNAYTPLQHPIPLPTTKSRLLKQTIMAVLSLISLPLVSYAVSLPTMERLVYGGAPTLLHDVLGMVWKQEYSLITLVATTGDAGGWDTFLMVTFGMFVVVGPILRSVALVLHVIMGLPVALLGECMEQPRRRTSLRMVLFQLSSTIQKALRPFIDASGAFCSWEVLIIALLMIQAEMPSITDTIHEDDRCLEADPEHGRTCIEVQFNIKDTFLLVVIAWAVLLGASAFVMDLAGSEEHTQDKNVVRYEYGMSIPRRTRANLSSDRSWKGALRDIDIADISSAMGEQLTSSPLLQNDSTIEEREPLEEIIFM